MTRFEALAAIRASKPLLHCISNLVTANDCANLALAVGASPIMAQAPQEMADIAVLASAVVLNTGTPDEAKFTAARLAGAAANRRGIPVVLDPVGVGASPWRLENIRQLLQEVHPAILRANYGEAAALLGLSAAEHGVDSLTVPIDAAACAKALAQKLGTVVVLSGAKDLVTDGTALHIVSGRRDLMRRVTGAGLHANGTLRCFCRCAAASPLTGRRTGRRILESLCRRSRTPGPRPGQFPGRPAGCCRTNRITLGNTA